MGTKTAKSTSKQTKGAAKPARKATKPATKKKTSRRAEVSGHAAAAVQAVHEKAAAAGGVYIGSLIYWNAGAVDVPRADARALFAAAQFDHLIPEELAHGSALTRAAGEAGKPRGFRIEAFAAPNSDTPIAVGVYRVDARKGEGGDSLVCGARVRVDVHAGEIVALAPEGAEPIPEALGIATAIATRANRLVTHIVAKDVSAAMLSAVRELAAVPLRDNGGIYLLPPSSDARWSALEGKLRELGFRPGTIRMHDLPENMAAAREAAQGALEGELLDLASDLEAAQAHGMRVGTIEARMDALAALKGRTELYRNVLESLADDLAARAGEMETAFAEQLEKERAALEARGKEAPPPGTSAAKGSDAANKAWATRRANGWTPRPRAAGPAPIPAPEAGAAAE